MKRTGRLIAGALLAAAMIAAGCASDASPADRAEPSSSSATPGGGATSPTATATPTTEVPPTQVSPIRECARPTLIGTVVADKVEAHEAPSPDATVVATFGPVNPQGAAQVFVLEEAVAGTDGITWYRAQLPIRPNGTSGFIPTWGLALSQTSYRLEAKLGAFTLTLWKGCRRVETYPIGLGKETTPTPLGDFYLISLLQPPNPNTPYGTYAYGLSAYSEEITDWEGGGVIGLHGTNSPSSVGQRVSHGCIRMNNEDIEELVTILPLGTPISIS